LYTHAEIAIFVSLLKPEKWKRRHLNTAPSKLDVLLTYCTQFHLQLLTLTHLSSCIIEQADVRFIARRHPHQAAVEPPEARFSTFQRKGRLLQKVGHGLFPTSLPSHLISILIMSDLPSQVSILVVGSGPAGLALSAALLTQGIRPDEVLLIEKRSSESRAAFKMAARATVLHAGTMEHLGQLDGVVEKVS